MYSDFEEAFIQTVDKHAPVKQRKPCQNPAPFINKELTFICIDIMLCTSLIPQL
jgi:hypothetical protein